MGVDEHSRPAPTTGQLLADAIVEVVDRRRFLTLPQLHAELAAAVPVERDGQRIDPVALLGDDPIGALRDGLVERADLFGVDDVVYSSASLVAGRRFTARTDDGLDVEHLDDLHAFAGIQRHLTDQPVGVPVTAGGRRVFVTDAVPRQFGSAGRYLVVGAPDDLTTGRFGSLPPDELAVEVIGPDRLASGETEVAALRSAVAEMVPPGKGRSARALVASAMFLNDRCFRAPTLPVTDLLAAAGLAERDGEWGRAGEAWATGAEDAADNRVDELVAEFGLDRAERRHLRLLVDQWRRWTGGRHVIDAAAFTASLGTGRVAAAFAEFWQPRTTTTIEAWMDQRRLVETVARSEPDHPAIAYLRGMIDLRLGDGAGALGHFESAAAADPEFLPVRDELGLLLLDQGQHEPALSLLSPGHPVGDAVRAVFERAERDRRQAEKADQCRCGSGRKYRSCCARQLRLGDDEAVDVLDIRLQAFLAAPPWSAQMLRLADIVSTEWCVMSFPEALAEPFVQDVLVVEGGGAAAYLAARRRLLPDDEIELLSQYTSRHREAFDVSAISGPAVELVDPDEGHRTTITDPELAESLEEGDAVLVRTVQRGGQLVPVGPHIRIPEDHVALLRVVLASRPTAEQLLGWVCRRAEILRPPIDLGADIDLRSPVSARPEGLEGFDIDDLARRAMDS